jgi:hypothetical protein
VAAVEAAPSTWEEVAVAEEEGLVAAVVDKEDVVVAAATDLAEVWPRRRSLEQLRNSAEARLSFNILYMIKSDQWAAISLQQIFVSSLR